jgi:hypothetical protein
MDDDEATVPDTTELQQALAPQLLPQFVRILAHAQQVRTWATQTTVLADAERVSLLEQLTALDSVAQALAEGYAALASPSAPDPDEAEIS